MSQHDHHHHSHELKGQNLFIAIILNIAITVGQVVTAIISGSLALLSDALHNFSDVLALVISYVANQLIQRKNTPSKTFGFKRAEIIAAFVNSATLIVIAVFLIKEAVQRFVEPQEIDAFWVIAMGGFSVVANGLSVILLHQDSSKNINIRSAYLHLFTDMLSSVAVLVGGVLIYFYKIYWVDPLLSISIAFYLIYSSWSIFITSLKILMQFTPPDLKCEDISAEIEKFEEIKNVHHTHLWQLNEGIIHFEAHLEFRDDLKLSEAYLIMMDIETLLKEKFKITHITLQPEHGSDDEHKLIVQDY
ncbi:cation diffusion facilitator family transporter [Flammeovirgaceae bacterium SG7u.111]|nr:cation diffusion facilitator family transporter [Flammeovirgaceae bacterium SG7u.132]WPO33582.1 cation diffusion facilitator family transporter [Flammeovirgaceae bacterium SG7u.111]